jgi:hypothetical protein
MGDQSLPPGLQCSPGLRVKLPADGTGFGSSSSLARNFERRLPLIALAQLGAYALTRCWTSWRTCDRRKSDWRLGLSRMLLPHFVPCRQGVISVCFFARTIVVRAYPTALTCKISMRWCAALRRPTCFELVCTCKFHECGGIRPVRVAAQRLQLSVYGRRSNRYAHCISTRTCSADQHCTPRRPRL